MYSAQSFELTVQLFNVKYSVGWCEVLRLRLVEILEAKVLET
jgi:hypothetical protein